MLSKYMIGEGRISIKKNRILVKEEKQVRKMNRSKDSIKNGINIELVNEYNSMHDALSKDG